MFTADRRASITCALVILIVGFGAGSARAQSDTDVPARRTVTIGFVHDGPPPDSDHVSIEQYQQVRDEIRREILALTRREFDVRFPADKELDGGWNVERIHEAIERLLADPEVDLVMTLGVFSSSDVCRRPDLPKPVIAPFAVDVVTQSLPFDGRSSGVRNLSYVVRRGSVVQDLKKFKELIDFERLYVVVDEMFMRSMPELEAFAHAAADTIETEVELVPVGLSADPAIAATAEAEAVYVTPLLRMPGHELDRLLEALIDGAIPSFSLQGEAVVRRGALAGLRRGTGITRLARRVALNVQRILLGEDAGTLPVVLDQREKLLINMTTAERIGFHPSWLLMLEADLLQPGGPWGHPLEPETLALSDAVHEAIRANLSLSVADRRVAAGRENIRFARSLWKPQVEAGAGGLAIDTDRAAASFGTQPERSWFGRVSATQLIYADDVNAGIVGAVEGQTSLERNREVEQLDVALLAATAFLDVLRAQSLERIEFDNLQLTESNLELARRRVAVGFSGPADVYRWESALATSRANRLAAHSRVHSAFVRLNQVLNRDQERQYHLAPPDLADRELVSGFGRLRPFVESWAGFALFREFSVIEGLADAPELASIDAQIAAERRERQAATRTYWAPTVSAFGEFERVFSKSGAGSADVSLGGPIGFSTADRDNWSLGLSATLPLYAGSARRARVRQSSQELLGLQTERRARSQRIELRIRLSLFDVAATFTAIPLARQAETAAQKNLELVRDSYSRGVVSVIELLDAQNAALVSGQFATNATYDFLLDLMELQRATNDFDFFRSAAGRDAWFERLAAFFEQAEFPLRSQER